MSIKISSYEGYKPENFHVSFFVNVLFICDNLMYYNVQINVFLKARHVTNCCIRPNNHNCCIIFNLHELNVLGEVLDSYLDMWVQNRNAVYSRLNTEPCVGQRNRSQKLTPA